MPDTDFSRASGFALGTATVEGRATVTIVTQNEGSTMWHHMDPDGAEALAENLKRLAASVREANRRR